MAQSAKNGYIYGSLDLCDNGDQSFYPVKPSYAGDIKYSVQSSDHNGWLKCDGRSLLRTTYPNLFNIIGTSFGSDNATTFKLPDCRGRVIGTLGSGSGLTSRSLGDLVGEERHTMTVNELVTHTHTINDPGHNHSYVNNTNDQNVNTLTTQDSAADNADLSATTGTSTTGITLNTTGNTLPFNVMQPTIFMGNVFIFSALL